jgi:predicted RNase H-like nuclease (RuvC/YqgF family)
MTPAQYEEIARELNALSRDLAVGLKSTQDLLTYQERRIAELEVLNRTLHGEAARLNAILGERAREADASRQHSTGIARLEVRLEEANTDANELKAEMRALKELVTKVAKFSDGAQVKKAQTTSLGAGAMGIAAFLAAVIQILISQFGGK